MGRLNSRRHFATIPPARKKCTKRCFIFLNIFACHGVRLCMGAGWSVKPSNQQGFLDAFALAGASGKAALARARSKTWRFARRPYAKPARARAHGTLCSSEPSLLCYGLRGGFVTGHVTG
jgi:hypothetical protein